MEKEKVSKATQLSTILIGIYSAVLFFVDISAVLFLRILGNTAMTGADITAGAGGSDDFISGYFVFPRILATVFGGMTEITVLIFAAGIFAVLLIFLAVLIVSCILIKKRKLKADAWVKIIVFSIFICMAAFFIQSAVIAVMMAVPVVFGVYVLAK